jgi:hypothetical protein
MNRPLLLALLFMLSNCSYRHENDQSAQTAAFAKEDSMLLADVTKDTGPKPRQILIFNDVPKLRQILGSVGIGDMREWQNDGVKWTSSSNPFEFSSRGSGRVAGGDLAFYLESPSEQYVELLNVNVSFEKKSETETALRKYAQTVEKTFNAVHLDRPSGLMAALLAGKPYEHSTKQRTIKNIAEPGTIGSWKLQVIAH